MTRTRTRLRWHRPCRNAPTADAPGKFIQRQVGNSDGISIPPTPVIATDRFPAAAPGIRPARRCRDRDYDRASQSRGRSNAARPGSALRPHLVGWPMPSPAMARRFWDKPACSPRRIERVLVPQHRLTDGLANPTLLEAHGGKNTHAAAVSADGGIIVGYGQLPSGAMVATAWINAPTYTAIQLHHGIDNPPRKRPEFPPTAR